MEAVRSLTAELRRAWLGVRSSSPTRRTAGHVLGRPAPADTVLETELPGVESNHRR